VEKRCQGNQKERGTPVIVNEASADCRLPTMEIHQRYRRETGLAFAKPCLGYNFVGREPQIPGLKAKNSAVVLPTL